MIVLNGSTDTRQVLVGWKEIAGELRVSRTTAWRWGQEKGLPVYRVGGQVRAIKREVKEWERENVTV